MLEDVLLAMEDLGLGRIEDGLQAVALEERVLAGRGCEEHLLGADRRSPPVFDSPLKQPARSPALRAEDLAVALPDPNV